MTADIVERLRDSADRRGDWRDGPTPVLEHEAADEIERLRGALQAYGDHTYECEFKEHLGRCTCGYSNALSLNE